MSRRTTKPVRPASRFAAIFAQAELELPTVAAAITQYTCALDDSASDGPIAFARGYSNLDDSDARYAYGAIIAHLHPEIEL